MARAGYDIVPVPVYYPDATEILGRPVYRTVSEVPGPVDMVNVFRRPRDIPPHVEDILAARPRVGVAPARHPPRGGRRGSRGRASRSCRTAACWSSTNAPPAADTRLICSSWHPRRGAASHMDPSRRPAPPGATRHDSHRQMPAPAGGGTRTRPDYTRGVSPGAASPHSPTDEITRCFLLKAEESETTTVSRRAPHRKIGRPDGELPTLSPCSTLRASARPPASQRRRNRAHKVQILTRLWAFPWNGDGPLRSQWPKGEGDPQ